MWGWHSVVSCLQHRSLSKQTLQLLPSTHGFGATLSTCILTQAFHRASSRTSLLPFLVAVSWRTYIYACTYGIRARIHMAHHCFSSTDTGRTLHWHAEHRGRASTFLHSGMAVLVDTAKGNVKHFSSTFWSRCSWLAGHSPASVTLAHGEDVIP